MRRVPGGFGRGIGEGVWGDGGTCPGWALPRQGCGTQTPAKCPPPYPLPTPPPPRLERACASADEFQARFLRERADRRLLHEQLSELRGNIRVMVRIRGGGGGGDGATVTAPHPGAVAVATQGRRLQEFEFTSSFGAAASQVGSAAHRPASGAELPEAQRCWA